MDPAPFTWRELDWMAEGKVRAMWDHTANLMAVLANCHRVKGKVFSARDFNPFYEPNSEVLVLNREGAAAVMLAMGGKPANVEGN